MTNVAPLDLASLGIKPKKSAASNALAGAAEVSTSQPSNSLETTAMDSDRYIVTPGMPVPPKPDIALFDVDKTFKTVVPTGATKPLEGFQDWPLDHPAARFLRTPKEGYVFKKTMLLKLIGFNRLHQPGENILVYGPTGCGKSTAIRQYHALLGIPLVEVAVNSSTRFEKLLGRTTFVNENGVQVLKYVLGPLGIALYLDIPILLDEIHKMEPGEATGLHALMDGEGVTIDGAGGLVLRPGPNFRMYMTANTSLSGDHTQLYRGSKTHDIALSDRVIFLWDSYPTKEEQLLILSQDEYGQKLNDATRKTMVNTAVSIQQAFLKSNRESGSGRLTKTLSVRNLVKWAKRTVILKRVFDGTNVMPIVHALDECMLAQCSEPETLAVLKILATHLQEGVDDGVNEDVLIRKLAASLQDPKGLDVDLSAAQGGD